MTTNSNPFLAYYTLHFWEKEPSRAENPIQQHLFARHPFEPFVTCLSVCPGHLYFQTQYFLFFRVSAAFLPFFIRKLKALYCIVKNRMEGGKSSRSPRLFSTVDSYGFVYVHIRLTA